MIRGTTPTLKFTLPFDTADITLLNISFAQEGRVVLEKKLLDCSLEGSTVSVALTEADTLSFDSDKSLVEIQLRVGCGEARLASNIIKTTVGRILKDGALE